MWRSTNHRFANISDHPFLKHAPIATVVHQFVIPRSLFVSNENIDQFVKPSHVPIGIQCVSKSESDKARANETIFTNGQSTTKLTSFHSVFDTANIKRQATDPYSMYFARLSISLAGTNTLVAIKAKNTENAATATCVERSDRQTLVQHI